MSHRQQNDGVSSSQVSRVDGVPSIDLVAPTERALGRLATLLVHKGGLQAGDVYCLHGDVGAGKSVFSRAFIRAAAGDPLLNVPSPTYLLQVGLGSVNSHCSICSLSPITLLLAFLLGDYHWAQHCAQ